jgi:ribulose-5-phosphate 4-epimerase/fuculose-1-phosphate aldolase
VEGDGSRGISAFQAAGRALLSLGLVKEAEGNLSEFDGRALRITRTGALLGSIGEGDVLEGSLDAPPEGASSDVDVHRVLYAERGPGAVVHAHPPGTVPEGGGGPGEHGFYVFAPTLEEATRSAVEQAWARGSHR